MSYHDTEKLIVLKSIAKSLERLADKFAPESPKITVKCSEETFEEIKKSVGN